MADTSRDKPAYVETMLVGFGGIYVRDRLLKECVERKSWEFQLWDECPFLVLLQACSDI